MRPIKKLFSSISILAFLSMAVVPTFSCSNSINSKDSQNGGDLNLDQSELDDSKGILDSRISEHLLNVKEIKYTEIESNIFGFDMYKEDFLRYFNPFTAVALTNVNKDYLKLDVYSLLERIYKSSDSKIDLSITKENINFDTTNDSISIDFEITISNTNKLARYFVVNNKEFFVTPFTTRILKIKAPMQKLTYTINYDASTKRNYLQWLCENVSFQVDDKIFDVKDFSFNLKKSYAIPYFVKNIFVENQNYINESEFDLKKLTSEEVKQDIANHFITTRESILKYIGYAHPILQEIVKNESLDKTIKTLAPTIANILVESKLIDQALVPFVVDLLSNEKGILTIFNEQKEVFTNIISKFLKDSSIPIESINEILKDLSPSMTDEKKEMFLNLIKSDFIPAQYQPILISISQLVFNDSNILNLIDAIFGELNEQVQGLLPQTELIKSIFSFLKFAFTKNQDGTYENTLQLLFKDKNFVASILKNILPVFGMDGYEKMIDQIYTNNNNFNITKFTNLLNTSIIPFAEFLATKENYEIVSQFVTQNNNDVYSYNKNTQQVTYKYELNFVFKKEFRLELQPFYNILPPNMDVNGTNVPISIILGVDVLPYFFTFGVNDSLDMLFSANNNYLYLTPVQELDHYVFNYTIPYTVDFKLNMPSGFDKMFREYDEKLFGWDWGLDTIPWGFIKSFSYSFLFPSYTLSGSLNATHSNWLNYNYLPSLPSLDLTFKWNELTDAQLQSLSTFIQSTDSNTYVVHNKSGKERTFTGKKPVLIESKREELQNMMFTIGEGFKSLPGNMQPVISINPTVDGKIVYTGSLDQGVNIKIMEISVYFPNPRIIDLNNSNIDTNTFVYQNMYKKSFSF